MTPKVKFPEFRATPLLVGPANCESMLGCPWRWLRRHAPELGLMIHTIDAKSFIDAQGAAEAIKRSGSLTEVSAEDVDAEPVDELEALRAKLGKRRVIG